MPSTFVSASNAIFLGALVAEFLILTHAHRIGAALGVMDHPDQIRKRHLKVTPLVGGLAVMVPLLIWTGAALTLGKGSSERLEIAILLCGAGATLLGYTDDQTSTSPSSRLLSLILLTVIALVIAPQLLPAHLVFGFAPSLSLAPWAAYGLITIAMAGFVNAVNMADGQNGIVTGMFVIWSTCLMVVTDGGFAHDLSRVLLAASALAFFFNMAGKVFLGDGGTYGVTFVFGLLAIAVHNAGVVPAATIGVWFFIPIMDCVRLIVSRVMNGRSPSHGDRNHFHHRLQARVGRSRGLILYLGAVGTSSLVAAFFPRLSILGILVLVIFYVSLARIDSEKILKVREVARGAGDRKFRVVVGDKVRLIEPSKRNADAR